MMERLHPKIKLLLDSLERVGIKEFIESKDFERLILKMELDEEFYHLKEKTREQERSFLSYNNNNPNFLAFSILLDGLLYDSIERAGYESNNFSNNISNNKFQKFTIEVLLGIIEISKKLPDFTEVLKDLSVLGFPEFAINLINKVLIEKKSRSSENFNQKSEANREVYQSRVTNQTTISSDLTSKWIRLLAKSDVQEVIDEMMEHFISNNKLIGEIVNISARWARLEKQLHSGTVKQDELDIEARKINSALLLFIRNLSTE